jgi:CIC family chloride channel protein
MLFKVIATALTFGAGGVGGIFAPSLFLGSSLGIWFSLTINHFKLGLINIHHFAFAGMAGLIAANLHAPLTAIFLIGDITGGYQMFIPLMIVSVFAYTTVKLFLPNSVYTIQLAKRGELLTHNSDQNILKMMTIEKVIERNFIPVKKTQTLGELVRVISISKRNIFPVIDSDNNLEGVVVMDQIREIMFDQDRYEDTYVSDLMIIPSVFVNIEDSMDRVATKFHESGNYNLPVLDKNDKYIGFVSRANVFTTYRRMLKHFSED